MNTTERARAMRDGGKSFAEISSRLGISLQHAYRIAGDLERVPPAEDARSVVRYTAHNGGCSSLSGKVPVSLPRIATLDGPYQVGSDALDVAA
jgi:hypothetical protein